MELMKGASYDENLSQEQVCDHLCWFMYVFMTFFGFKFHFPFS
jgi:hypothetical protein